MSATEPETGEIWEDGEGCLMTCAGLATSSLTGEQSIVWYVFARESVIPTNAPKVTQPLRRAFDIHGNFVLGEDGTDPVLRYPDQYGIRRKPTNEGNPA